MNTLLIILVTSLLSFLVGGLCGALLTYSKLRGKLKARLVRADRERRNLDQAPKILNHQVWWYPGVGRCVVAGIYEEIDQITVVVPDLKSALNTAYYEATKSVALGFKDFQKRAVYLAAYDGGAENDLPIEALMGEQEDEALMQEAREEVERELRGEMDLRTMAKLDAIVENQPEGSQEERWAWATGAKKTPDLGFL